MKRAHLYPFLLGLLVTVVTILPVWLILDRPSGPTTPLQAMTPSPPTPTPTAPALARQLTVRVLVGQGAGSGVLVARRGRTYTVLTCEHVVAVGKPDQVQVLAPDGTSYPARLLPWPTHLKLEPKLDLAFLTFESSVSYPTVRLAPRQSIQVGQAVYASGFPNYRTLSPTALQDTRNWGLKAYRLTTGQVSLISDRSLPGGYRLGYTNEIEQGMSGGPVLNSEGELVGINGRLKYPLQGIAVFKFTDGSQPSPDLFHQMEALSWAVPVTTFERAVEQVVAGS